LGDRDGESIGLLHLGQIAFHLDDDEQARGHLEQSLAIAKEIASQETEAECELLLGEIAFEAGDRPQARQRYARSLTVSLEAADKRGEANALWSLGKADLDSDDDAQARTHICNALQKFRDLEMWQELSGCLEDCAVLALAEGSFEVAVRLASAANRSRERLGLKRPPRTEKNWQLRLDTFRQTLTKAEFDAAWAEGVDWQIDHAIAVSLSERRTPIEV